MTKAELEKYYEEIYTGLNPYYGGNKAIIPEELGVRWYKTDKKLEIIINLLERIEKSLNEKTNKN